MMSLVHKLCFVFLCTFSPISTHPHSVRSITKTQPDETLEQCINGVIKQQYSQLACPPEQWTLISYSSMADDPTIVFAKIQISMNKFAHLRLKKPSSLEGIKAQLDDYQSLEFFQAGTMEGCQCPPPAPTPSPCSAPQNPCGLIQTVPPPPSPPRLAPCSSPQSPCGQRNPPSEPPSLPPLPCSSLQGPCGPSEPKLPPPAPPCPSSQNPCGPAQPPEQTKNPCEMPPPNPCQPRTPTTPEMMINMLWRLQERQQPSNPCGTPMQPCGQQQEKITTPVPSNPPCGRSDPCGMQQGRQNIILGPKEAIDESLVAKMKPLKSYLENQFPASMPTMFLPIEVRHARVGSQVSGFAKVQVALNRYVHLRIGNANGSPVLEDAKLGMSLNDPLEYF